MQAAYLISTKGFSEKQVGVIFLVFGLSQFLCMAPAGYFLDYSNHKINWVISAAVLCSVITVFTDALAVEGGRNMHWQIVWHIVQGGITAILPPGFNGITLGVVGSTGFTHQVSRNRMMNHIGTALVVAIGSLVAYVLYPNIGALFIVSPLAALGVVYHLCQVLPSHVDRDAARALIIESPTMDQYEMADNVAAAKQQAAVLNWEATGDGLSEATDSSSDAGSGTRIPISYDGSVPKPPPAEQAAPRSYSNEASYRPPNLLNDVGLQPPSTSSQPSSVVGVQQSEPWNMTTGSDPRTRSNTSATASEQPTVGTNDTPESGKLNSSYSSMPSFNFGWNCSGSQGSANGQDNKHPRARTPLAVLMNPTLFVFAAVIFFFHLANSSVLPLVMQSLALRDAQAGILLSGLCILIAQGFMAFFAKICGDYSPIWGRKNLLLVGLVSLTLRCFLLTMLLSAEEEVETERGAHILKALILSTQLLDSVGAGILGTLQILVTNDISGGTGRFSLLLGVTTSAMCLGATVSGYLGQALAQDYGYPYAFTALGIMSLIPFALYVFFMPETLPDYARPQPPKKRRRRLRELLKRLNESRRRILASKNNPFRRHENEKEVDTQEYIKSPMESESYIELV